MKRRTPLEAVPTLPCIKVTMSKTRIWTRQSTAALSKHSKSSTPLNPPKQHNTEDLRVLEWSDHSSSSTSSAAGECSRRAGQTIRVMETTA